MDAETWFLVAALRARGELTAAGRAALAAAYPDAIAVARARSKSFREQSSLTETALYDH